MVPSRICVCVLTLFVVGACERARPAPGSESSVEPSSTQVLAPAPAPDPPPSDSAIVGMCHPDGDRLCVLHADGRVSCAKLDGGRFDPPLEAIAGAVEMSCGWGLVCTRTASDELRCADEDGKRFAVDLPDTVRSLDDNCFVDSKGALKCWDQQWAVEVRGLPKSRHGVYPELERVILVDDAAGCVLGVNGQLWCWSFGDSSVGAELGTPDHVNDHTEERTYDPRRLTIIEGEVEELLHRHNALCWRLSTGWECAMWNGEIGPAPTCASHPCVCRTSANRMWCDPGELELGAAREAGLEPPDPRTLVGIVRQTHACALDLEGHVWCGQGEFRKIGF